MRRFNTNSPIHTYNPPDAALLHAVYLLACHFVRSPLTIELEPGFLSSTLDAISSSLEYNSTLGQKVDDIVQASSLLGFYFYFQGRILEAHRHAFSAARLAVKSGLHQIQPDLVHFQQLPHASGELKESHQKAAVFWQIFMLDRCWVTANGQISGLPDTSNPRKRVTTPLPTLWDDEFGVRRVSFFAAFSMLTNTLISSHLLIVWFIRYLNRIKFLKSHLHLCLPSRF